EYIKQDDETLVVKKQVKGHDDPRQGCGVFDSIAVVAQETTLSTSQPDAKKASPVESEATTAACSGNCNIAVSWIARPDTTESEKDALIRSGSNVVDNGVFVKHKLAPREQEEVEKESNESPYIKYPFDSTDLPQFRFFANHGHFPKFPNAVTLHLEWVALLAVNPLENTFKARINLTVDWFDPAFAHGPYIDRSDEFVFANTRPVLFFANCVELTETAFGPMLQLDHDGDREKAEGGRPAEKVMYRRDGAVKNPPGTLRKSGFFTGTFTESFQLREFPCDVQSRREPGLRKVFRRKAEPDQPENDGGELD
ncbi:unnamed protein product, partial [Amoebophrya sp. A120]